MLLGLRTLVDYQFGIFQFEDDVISKMELGVEFILFAFLAEKASTVQAHRLDFLGLASALGRPTDLFKVIFLVKMGQLFGRSPDINAQRLAFKDAFGFFLFGFRNIVKRSNFLFNPFNRAFFLSFFKLRSGQVFQRRDGITVPFSNEDQCVLHDLGFLFNQVLGEIFNQRRVNINFACNSGEHSFQDDKLEQLNLFLSASANTLSHLPIDLLILCLLGFIREWVQTWKHLDEVKVRFIFEPNYVFGFLGWDQFSKAQAFDQCF